MKVMIFWTACVISVLFAASSQAALIAWDSFATTAGGNDYVVGPIQNQNPTAGLGGFTGAWNRGTNHPAAAHGGLAHDLTPGTIRDGQIVSATFTSMANRRLSRKIDYTPTDGTYYMSALFQKNEATTKHDILAGLSPLEGVTTSFPSTRATYIGIVDGGISFFSHDIPGLLYELVPASQMPVGETFFALLQYDYGTSGSDTVTATVFDGSSSEVANRPFPGLNLDGYIGRFGFATSDFSPTVVADEWRFGSELSDVMVSVAQEGDFDGDRDVDGADFLVWQRGELPSPWSSSDLDAWQTNFGPTESPMAMASTGVPEPSTGSMLLLGIMAFFRRRR